MIAIMVTMIILVTMDMVVKVIMVVIMVMKVMLIMVVMVITGVSITHFAGRTLPLKYSNFQQIYKKLGQFHKKHCQRHNGPEG